MRSEPRNRRLIRACVVLLATFGAVSSSAGAADLGYQGFELRGGVLAPDDWDTGFSLGVGLDFGEITDDLSLFGVASYGAADASHGLPGFGVVADKSIDVLSVGAEVRWVDHSPWFWGGGVQMQFLECDADALGVRFSESENELALQFVGGYEFGETWAVELRHLHGLDSPSLFDGFGAYVVWRSSGR